MSKILLVSNNKERIKDFVSSVKNDEDLLFIIDDPKMILQLVNEEKNEFTIIYFDISVSNKINDLKNPFLRLHYFKRPKHVALLSNKEELNLAREMNLFLREIGINSNIIS